MSKKKRERKRDGNRKQRPRNQQKKLSSERVNRK